MIIKFNLNKGNFGYIDSIAQMRTLLAMPGGRNGYFQLDLILKCGGAPTAHLLMSRKTLYIDAFRGKNNIWHYFNDAPRPSCAELGIAGNVSPLRMSGTHTSLGTATAACVYDTATHSKLHELTNFEAGESDLPLKLLLSFAVVSCAEAVRFKEAEKIIADLLEGRIPSYKPFNDWQATYKNWESLTQQNTARVWVKHVR